MEMLLNGTTAQGSGSKMAEMTGSLGASNRLQINTREKDETRRADQTLRSADFMFSVVHDQSHAAHVWGGECAYASALGVGLFLFVWPETLYMIIIIVIR